MAEFSERLSATLADRYRIERRVGQVRRGSSVGGTFAVTPDDQRFLMVRDRSGEEMAGTPTMVVVENFFAAR